MSEKNTRAFYQLLSDVFSSCFSVLFWIGLSKFFLEIRTYDKVEGNTYYTSLLLPYYNYSRLFNQLLWFYQHIESVELIGDSSYFVSEAKILEHQLNCTFVPVPYK